jgi:C1A family cysteine protease
MFGRRVSGHSAPPERPRRLRRQWSLVALAFLPLLLAGALQAAGAEADAAAEPSIAPSIERLAEEQPPGMGFVPPPGEFSPIAAPMAATRLALPSRFDWRETGKVTPVKNQGSCGSCYAFAAVACFESKALIDGAGSFDFSENNVKECEWFGSSCSGGNDWIVANYLSTKGTVLETCDPYAASNVPCKSGCEYQKTLVDWHVISFSEIPDADVLKSYIQTYGPVYTSMYAGNGDAWYSEFQRYNGSYTLYYAGTQATNHAVLIVGWDDGLAHAGGTGGWIVKNSWGTSWGGTCGYGSQRGYFTIAYESARIGSYSSFLSRWQNYDPQATLLYHDEGGYTGSVGYMTTTAWGLCKFVPESDCTVDRVEFWTLDATTDIDVYIYDSFSANVPSGLLASRPDNSFSLAGYHSVDLASPLRVDGGNDIYVVVKIKDVSRNYPLAYDTAGPKASGSSFISANGSYFTEFTNGDLGLRLRTRNVVGCADATPAPAITEVADAPSDAGGYVDISWRRSSFDSESSTPAVRAYRVWRKKPDATQSEAGPDGQVHGSSDGPQVDGPYEYSNTGSPWELVATLPAEGECCYDLTVPTNGNTTYGDTCWTYFYVSAHAGQPGKRFDSPVVRGYSIDDLGLAPPPGDEGNPEDADGLAWDRQTASLAQPRPNPAADGFDLAFSLLGPGPARLAIYDVAGREIAVLADGLTGAGAQTRRWGATSDQGFAMPPGVYFARLERGLESHTVKLVLAR